MSSSIDFLPPRLRALVRLTEAGCWEWRGRRSRNGYGRILLDGIEIAAHRFVYQAMISSVGARTQLDHLCTNRSCVNPDHLEPVSPRENYKRRDQRLTAKRR